MADWFASNAPQQTTAQPLTTAGDWFSKNAPPPGVQKPNIPVQSSLADEAATRAMNVGRNLASTYGGLANQIYDVSTPNIATQIYRKITGKPNTLDKIPQQAVQAFLAVGGVPESEFAEPEAAVSKSESAVKPQATAPSVPPTRTPLPASVQQPVIKPAAIEQQFGEALGAKPLQPNVSLLNQLKQSLDRLEPGEITRSSNLPAGHTPVESTALKSYKYDPAAREFEVVFQGGGHYVYGDVSPEAAAKFEAASSKGKAWPIIKNEGTEVAKFINGKRVPIQPPVNLRTATPDMTVHPAETLQSGDTFVDETGEPRRVTAVEGNKIRTADGTLKTYTGNITARGDLNSPQAQLAQGGKFHPPNENEPYSVMNETEAGQRAAASLPEAIMEVLNKHPEGNFVRMSELMEDPALAGHSQADVETAIGKLWDAQRIWEPATDTNPGGRGILGIQKRAARVPLSRLAGGKQ